MSETHFSNLTDIIPRIDGLAEARIATAGSCFAQHIGHALRTRGLRYMDMEPVPALLDEAAGAQLGYGLFSCRYGNIYTARQLLQLFQEAWEFRKPADGIWEKDGRFYDAMRPSMEPGGMSVAREVRTMRKGHLRRVRRMFTNLDIFVFTLGLTEAWVSREDGTVYPTAPGVVAGTYDPEAHEFVNFGFREVMADMEELRDCLLAVNPGARMILTVSPVGLAATATDNHVLTATTYSKSVLRAVAGELAASHDDVTYFPSYELIVGQPTGHSLYEPNLREVSQFGVNEVMRQFFAVNAVPGAPQQAAGQDEDGFGYEQCDEAQLSQEAPQ